ncbi:hypothetical protein OIU84_016832 [Salix udensis]|uniref:B box-type domain-containing protein n=1 Tax=Salix udensis TaxID=889485 RepID=A0AAD6JAY5_9ROSI|nr:hypothetical protein OIU84_016832 [Salix udensis]
MVYCRSDAASLCLSCDRNVHSANALSKRHSRNLLCERCNSQPAIVRCAEERISLCQNCDWIGHGTSTSASTHRRQTINSYSGCPSASELSSIWSFVLDFPSRGESTFNDRNEIAKSGVWHGSSSIPESSSSPNNPDQPTGSANTSLPKLYCPGTKCPVPYDDANLYEEFNMDEMDLSLENYEELFGVTLNNSEELLENGGIDSLFGTKDMSGADSNCQGAVAAEVLFFY